MPSYVLGVDQSTTKIGFAVVKKGEVVSATTVDLSKLGAHTQRRMAVAQMVKSYLEKYPIRIVVVERVRLFTHNRIAANTIMLLAAMTSTIVDAAFVTYRYKTNKYGIRSLEKSSIPVYSVDTRAWKNEILGSPKATKEDAVKFADRFRHPTVIAAMPMDHNAADAICLAFYPFTGKKLQREK